MSNHPIRDKVYSFADLAKLDLDDMPFLRVVIEGQFYPVQTSHVRDEDMVAKCPEWQTSNWKYLYTTREMIPLFSFVGTDEQRDKLIDYEEVTYDNRENQNNLDEPEYWVTPKGSPREQYVWGEILIG